MKNNNLRDKDFDPFIDNSKKKIKQIEIENNNKKKRSFKKLDKVDLILSLVFVIMIVVIVFLSYKVVTKRNDYKEHVKSSIIIPLLGKETNNEISVDVSNMRKGDSKDYSFRISNNKDNNVNKEEVPYEIELLETDDFEIEVYKNSSKKNILNKDNTITNNKLIGNEEQIDTYVLKIKANKKTSKRQLITIRVIS